MSNHHVAKSQAEMAELFSQDLTTGVGRSVKHDSADKHVSGEAVYIDCLLYTSPSPRDRQKSRMPSSA